MSACEESEVANEKCEDCEANNQARFALEDQVMTLRHTLEETYAENGVLYQTNLRLAEENSALNRRLGALVQSASVEAQQQRVVLLSALSLSTSSRVDNANEATATDVKNTALPSLENNQCGTCYLAFCEIAKLNKEVIQLREAVVGLQAYAATAKQFLVAVIAARQQAVRLLDPEQRRAVEAQERRLRSRNSAAEDQSFMEVRQQHAAPSSSRANSANEATATEVQNATLPTLENNRCGLRCSALSEVAKLNKEAMHLRETVVALQADADEWKKILGVAVSVRQQAVRLLDPEQRRAVEAQERRLRSRNLAPDVPAGEGADMVL